MVLHVIINRSKNKLFYASSSLSFITQYSVMEDATQLINDEINEEEKGENVEHNSPTVVVVDDDELPLPLHIEDLEFEMTPGAPFGFLIHIDDRQLLEVSGIKNESVPAQAGLQTGTYAIYVLYFFCFELISMLLDNVMIKIRKNINMHDSCYFTFCSFSNFVFFNLIYTMNKYIINYRA